MRKDVFRAVVLSLEWTLESPGKLKGADAWAPPKTSLILSLVVWPSGESNVHLD